MIQLSNHAIQILWLISNKKTSTFSIYLNAHIVKYNAHFFNIMLLVAISLSQLASTGGVGVSAVTFRRVCTVSTDP